MVDQVLGVVEQAENLFNDLYHQADRKGWDDVAALMDEYSGRLEDIRDHCMHCDIIEEAQNIREDQE